ncbi:GNAT family N-acetyltransferase [Saccharothrix australiensis]|uniref:Acetyltransferase (GNAT) family protein n=1 Tax=Saccharothrix australiensis TaxID=2072 RepID=A0A495VXS5_9PSEU|nr:GNAT family N-acetyltransferase [Saccharothrix australiensis]RKT54231.1 acetyltransferase (GNAT) family protein [Saccharothrix australiensis]
MTEGVEIAPFTPGAATEADLIGYHDVMLARQETDRPDEPRLSYDDCLGRLNTPFPGFGPVAYWVARTDGALAGSATVYFPDGAAATTALAEIVVHPRYRGRGIGTALLREVLPELRARGRSVVEGWQVTRGSAGDRWAAGLGFRTVHTVVLQLLLVAERDAAAWTVPVPPGYRLRQWSVAAPAELTASYVLAREAIHDAPIGDLAVRPPKWTVEYLRAREAEMREQDVELRVVVAQHEATGVVAGFTEVELHPHRPNWAFQRDTAVVSAHRGRGLGRSVKARMMRWLLADRPNLERVYTGTGVENVHMQQVNHQLGFSTVRTMIAVNQEITRLEETLT